MRNILLIFGIFCIAFLGKAGVECAYEQVLLSQQPVAYYRFSDPIRKGGDQLYSQGTLPFTNSFYHPINRSYLAEGAVSNNAAAGFSGAGVRFYVMEKLQRTNSFTIELWAKSDVTLSIQDTYMVPVGHWYADWDRAYGYFLCQNSQNEWEFRLGGNTRKNPCILKGGTVSPGEWTHLVGTYYHGEVQFFINGELVAEDITPNYSPSSKDFEIGGNGGGNYPWFGGIDEVALYSERLSAEEIAKHYELRNDADKYAKQILSLKPLAYWRLDETLPNKSATNSVEPENYNVTGTYCGAASASFGDTNEGYFDDNNRVLCLTNNMDYLQIDVQNGVELPAWSFSCWVQIPGHARLKDQNLQPLLTHSIKKKNTYQDDFEFLLQKVLDDGKYKISIVSNNGTLKYDLPNEINLYAGNSGWNYLAAVFYSKKAFIYVYSEAHESYGLKPFQVLLDTEPFNFTGRFRLGAYGNCGDQGNEFAFRGCIDEFALFDRALTEDEIQLLFKSADFPDPHIIPKLTLFSKPDGYYLKWDATEAILMQTDDLNSEAEACPNAIGTMKIPLTGQRKFYYLKGK